MAHERIELIDEIFNDALELAPSERIDYVHRTCGADGDLREELESLLAAHHAAEGFLTSPAADLELADHEHVDLPLPIGAVVGPYRLVRALATGGMGTVYEASRTNAEFDQRVAIKVLFSGVITPAMRRRFHVERQTLADLEHPFITRLIDGGTTEERVPYLVMEYVDGVPIDRFCDERRLDIRQRLELFRKVCEAVQFAHQNLTVHRDLKPGNILVTPQGNPKLVDFGIAKLLDRSGGTHDATVTALRALTPRYASPEQVRGDTTTTLSDVYSLGVILYELLTGRRPYVLDSRPDSERQRIVCEQEPPTPSVAIQRDCDFVASGDTGDSTSPDVVSELRGDDLARLQRRLRGDLDNIVLMALQKEPPRRYRSVEQLSDDVGRYLRGWPVLARKDTLAYRSAKLIKRNKPVFIAIACLAIVLILGVIGTGSGWFRAREAQRLAMKERNAALAARSDAEAVTAYMQRIFAAANPYRRGRNATVVELLADAETRLDRDLADKPTVEAGVRYAIGHTYAGMWMWPEAAHHLDLALQRYREAGMTRTEEGAKCLTLLGRALTFAILPESVPIQQQALDIRTELFGATDPRTAEAKGNLAYALWHGASPGNYDRAEEAYRDSIRIFENAPSEFRPDLARFTFSLAVMLRVRERYDEAGPLFARALAIYRELPTHEDRYMVECMKKYAVLLVITGKLELAEQLLFEVLRETPLGNAGAETQLTFWQLGRARLRAHDYPAAERAFLAAISSACDDAAVNHPQHQEVLTAYAAGLRPENSIAISDRPMVPALALLGDLVWTTPGHMDARLFDLASCVQQTGAYDKAETMLRTHVSNMATDQVRSALAKAQLGIMLTETGKLEEAAPLLSESVPFLEALDTTNAIYERLAERTLTELQSLP